MNKLYRKGNFVAFYNDDPDQRGFTYFPRQTSFFQKTEVEIYLIEQKLEQTINKIIRGDWMTASNALSAVTVEAPLDQTLYDEISNFITQYIADNY